MTITAQTAAAFAAIADYADGNADTAFTAADAGVTAADARALAEDGYVEITENGEIDILVTPADGRAAKRTHPDATPVKVLAEGNPKRGKSAERFALYADARTVADYVAACTKAGYTRAKALADVRWDAAKGLIEVGA